MKIVITRDPKYDLGLEIAGGIRSSGPHYAVDERVYVSKLPVHVSGWFFSKESGSAEKSGVRLHDKILAVSATMHVYF